MGDIRVFKRYEKKYILSTEERDRLTDALGEKLIGDEYMNSLVQNVYYDTPDFRLIRESIEKPLYKEKLRLRGYNTIDDSTEVYLEIKKKYDGVVYKRRERMRLDNAEAFIRERDKDGGNQIGRELKWFIEYYDRLMPAVYLGYERVAYRLPENGVRVTFDGNIRFRTENVSLTEGFYGKELLEPDRVIMELKAPGAIPLYFVRLIEDMGILPTSYSKYGTAYKNEIIRKQGN